MKSMKTIALVGNPNCGKTTLFNELTGSRQHVGNYPGVTVDKKEGTYIGDSGEIHIVDLPGIYSLTAYSIEEVVARDFIINEKPDILINILDASNLERNLYLSVQLMELGLPICIALNMMDVAKTRGINIDVDNLSKLLDIPVIPIIARNGQGIDKLMDAAYRRASENRSWEPHKVLYGQDISQAILAMEQIIISSGFMTQTYPSRWVAIKYLENDEQIRNKGRSENPNIASSLEEICENVALHLQRTLDIYPEEMIADHRYGHIRSILKQNIITYQHDPDRLYISDKIDKVVTHRFLGPLIMLAVLFSLYQFTFAYSEVPLGWIDSLFEWIKDLVARNMQDSYLKSLIISGIIDGVGGVFGFVPLIMFMFFGITMLEDSGYLARVAFMLDRVFMVFGMHGSSVMSYILSGGIAGGCAVPGVMATRILRGEKERLATLLTAPFMNCGAKLPILSVLIATFFVDYKASLMFLLTLLSWLGAMIVAKILRMTIIRGPASPFVMELPPYRFPTFKGLFIHTFERTWQYMKKAGTVILAISIVLWAMMRFPEIPISHDQAFKSQQEVLSMAISKEIENGKPDEAHKLQNQLDRIRAEQESYRLRYSVAGRIGTYFESVSKYVGFDWRINIALIGGFTAKEVIVSTLGTAYSLTETKGKDESVSLARMMAESKNFTPASALALIVFTIFYSPCFVTVVCIMRETHSWRWGIFSMIFNTLLASFLAFVVFQVSHIFV